MPKHIHAELIKLWADGEKIQFFGANQWEDCVIAPAWLPDGKYRLKPKPKTIKYKDYLSRVVDGGKMDEEIHYLYVVRSYNFDNVFTDKDLARQGYFVQWIDTEWQEVEIPG